MQDGLGLVFEQQGDTGAAAYNKPTLQMGNTPMDKIAEAAREQTLFERNQKAIADSAAAKKQQAAEAALAPKDLSGWVNDTEELGAIGNEMKEAYTGLIDAGVSPTNYKDPKAKEYQAILNKSNMILATSKQQEKDYLDVMDMISADPEKYDVPATMAKANEIKKIPLRQRLDRSFKEALVLKEKPLDILEPLADIKIASYSDPSSYEDPSSSSSSNKLKAAELRAAIEANVDNPVRAEKVNKVLASGQFKDKKEYVDYLYKLKADEFKKDAKYQKKEPKVGYERTYLTSANTEDLKKKFNVGTMKANIKSGIGSGITTPMAISNSINLGGINITVPNADAIDAETGAPLEGTGAIELKSGQIATPLVGNNGAIMAIPKTGIYKLKVTPTGEELEYKGTQKQIEAQLIRDGYGRYKTMLLGTYKDGDDTKTAWVPSSAIRTTTENKTLEGAEAAILALDRIAAEDTRKAASTVPNNPANKKAAAATTPVVKKTTIKRSDIPKIAQDKGYTTEEYTKLLEKNNIQIID